ncbi:MAG: MarR family transcriptional regulator [Clostridia bacterium]|nr:MarR family transcriptional regulator [Clostridia bacterium]
MNREKLAENLQILMPVVFKKLMKTFPELEISKHMLELLFMIKKEDSKPMSYFSEKLMLPKSNLTVMADRLIEEGFIERAFDPNDRRVIILRITEKGDQYLCKAREKVKLHVAEKLVVFSDEEINRLNELVEEMKAIFSKMD